MGRMLATGLQVTILGMGIVFVFLALLVVVMYATAAVFRRIAPDAPGAAGTGGAGAGAPLPSSLPGGPGDGRVRAAAIAAVTHYRRTVQQPHGSTEEQQ